MAAVFIDGFDHYNPTVAAQCAYKYQSGGANSAVTGRFGGQAIRRSSGGGASFTSKTLSPALSGDTLIVGLAFRTSAFNFPETRIFDIGSFELRIGSSGLLRISRATDNTLVTAPDVLTASVWYHIECKVVRSATVGTASLRINGVEVASGTGLNTGTTVGSQFNMRHMTGGAGQPTWDIDDLYLLDGSGGVNDDVLGDCKIETGWPTGAGNSTQWAPSAGSNYQNVDDSTSIDGDTTYNDEDTPGDKDTFAMTDLSTTGGTVYAVQVMSVARKTDAGTREVCNVVRHSGSDTDLAAATLGSSFDGIRDILDQTPASADWTISDVNALEAGYKLVT
jgi:hypothetical protein